MKQIRNNIFNAFGEVPLAPLTGGMGIDWQLNLNEIISGCYIVGGLGIRGILVFLYLEHM